MSKVGEPAMVIKKNKSGFGYKYVNEEEILSKITGLMKKYHVSLHPEILHGTLDVNPYLYKKTKTTKKGDIYEENVNEILVTGDMNWVWVNNDNPEEKIYVPWALAGQQSDASQAFGSALTYTSRYFLLKYFNIATSEDDPDAFRSKQKQSEAEEDAIAAESVIEQVNEVVNDFMKENEELRPQISEIIKKYAFKNGKPSTNYYNIKESIKAAKLLEEIKEFIANSNKREKQEEKKAAKAKTTKGSKS